MLYNVGTGQFFTQGNDWGTRASITTNGSPSSALTLTLTTVGTNYKLGTYNNNGVEVLNATDLYVDQSHSKNSTWTFEQVSTDNGPVYTIKSADNHNGGSGYYMTAQTGNTIVWPSTDTPTAYGQWKLLAAAKVPLVGKIAEYQEVRATVMGFAANTSAYTDQGNAAATLTAAVTAQDAVVNDATTTTEIDDAISAVKAAGNTFLESVIITAGFDITNVWITNPAPGISGNTDGWTNSGNPGVQNQLFEYWNVSGASTKQTLANLPKGAYKLTAIAYTRDNMTATLYAGDFSTNLVGCGSVNDRAGGSNWIAENSTNGRTDLNFTLDAAAASLEIGLIADNATGDHWMCWRSFSLTYYGDPINLKKAELAEAVAAAQAIDGNTIPTAAKAEIDAVVTAQNNTYSTIAEYQAAIDAIYAAISTYASAEIVTAYLTVINAKALYNQTDYTDKNGAKAAFKALIDAADATTNLTDLNDAIDDLKTGLTSFISTVTLNENACFDVTNFFVVNPSVSQNTTGWTIEGTPNGNYSFGVCNYGECEFYNNNFKFYQTLALTPGTWEFGVTGFHRAGTYNTYFYAGDDKILIPGVGSDVVNSMAGAKTYFDNGNGKVALKFLVETAQDIEIGIDNQDTQTDKWTIFRNFTLKYYGAPDYSVYDQQWADAVAAANAAKADAAYANVTGSELTALNDAIADSPVGSNLKATYTAKINALGDAVQAFIAAAPNYDAYVEIKGVAEALSVATGNAPTSAADALTKTHTLNVAVYNATTAANIFDVTNIYSPSWSSMGTSSGQHWSGDTSISYADDWRGDTNATERTTTVTLPAGEFILMSAGRGSSNVVTTMSANGTTVTFASNGDMGIGINKEGAASFDASDAAGFSHKSGEAENTGTGWEWRYIPVTLSAETDVTVSQKLTRIGGGWGSFSDFRILKKGVVATTSDYTALNNAISAAEAKTLGFESGQYAPYNNVAVLTSLAQAKAIDQSENNAQDIIQALTTALGTWNVNSTWVQPIYNGMFATVAEGANYPEGWRRSNNWGQMQSGISGDFATAYYNQPGSLVYGDQGVYTMPLPANQAYKLTFSYRSHENNSNDGMTVRVSNNGNDLIAPTYDGNGATDTWKTEYAYFTTGAAGNYVIKLENRGNTWMTNVSLEKSTPAEVAGDINGDGKIDDTDEWIQSLNYTAGDFNNTGTIESSDVTTLVNILVGKTTDYNASVADVNGADGVTLADLTLLINGMNDPSLLRTVDEAWKYATINATVYAEQTASENAAGVNYTIDSAISVANKDVSDKYDMKDYLTTLNITTTLSNVKSVSVYAKGKENIAGVMAINVENEVPTITYSAGNSPSDYASNDQANKNMFSDVVTVTGDNAGTYTAYLLPVALSNGVTVTVRDSNGKFYSQDYTVTAGQENNLTFTETTATNNWMATIPGNVNFSMLSTPGSHNSATSDCGSAAKCQSETIAQQLANGVRAFDIRPGYKYSSTITVNNLYIYHGMVNTNVLYKDAIAAMVQFLQAHPTEAISVIMVKEDGTPLLSSWTDYTTEMCNSIDEIHSQYTDYIKLLDHSYYTLDDYRGKIFFGYRNAWDLHKTVRVTNWPDDGYKKDYSVGVGGTCYASVEDAYNTSGSAKTNVVKELLDLASGNTDRKNFHYTFTSVANSITSSASTQNPEAATYISNTLTGPTGYVYADFMGSSSYSGQALLKAVIEQNYKYVFQGRTRKQ